MQTHAEERTCPECGTPIRGRIDKKFCSDLCRNAFNNKVNSDSNNYVRNINNLLRKNRRVLEESLKGDKTTIPKQRLVAKGFDFHYHTHQVTYRNEHTYTFCYEYGYLPLDRDMILIVKKSERSEKQEQAG
jgi:predicted nucleic acid-binding Zn ribbon protein